MSDVFESVPLGPHDDSVGVDPTVQDLNGTLLTNAKHGCVLRRIDMQTDDRTARTIKRLDETVSTIRPAYDECLTTIF